MDAGYEGQRLHISEGKGGVPGAGTSGDRSGAGRIPDAFSSQESKAKEDQNRMIHQNQERAIRSIIRVRSSLLERQRIQLFLQWASFARQQQAVARLSETTQEAIQRREESFQQSLAELQGRWDASKQEAESQLRELQSAAVQESRRHAMREIRSLLESQRASVRQRAFVQWMQRALEASRTSETATLKGQVVQVELKESCEVDGDGAGDAARGREDAGGEQEERAGGS